MCNKHNIQWSTIVLRSLKYYRKLFKTKNPNLRIKHRNYSLTISFTINPRLAVNTRLKQPTLKLKNSHWQVVLWLAPWLALLLAVECTWYTIRLFTADREDMELKFKIGFLSIILLKLHSFPFLPFVQTYQHI